MSEYTPTPDEVRDRYADARVGIGEWTRFDESVRRAVEEAYEEFDRMIAAIEREAAARALVEVAEAIKQERPEMGMHILPTPYRDGKCHGIDLAWSAVTARAAEIREGESDAND